MRPFASPGGEDWCRFKRNPANADRSRRSDT